MSPNQENTESTNGQEASSARMPLPLAKILAIILAVTTLGFAGTTTYLYRQNQQLKNPQQAAQAELKTILKRISKLMTLPEGEEPTLATVAHPDQLKNDPFFAQAKTGDKVLVYTQAKRVILYDPQANIVLNVAPLNPDAFKKTETASPTATDEKTQK